MPDKNAFQQIISRDQASRFLKRIVCELASSLGCWLFVGWGIVLVAVEVGVPTDRPLAFLPLLLLLIAILADGMIRTIRILRFRQKIALEQQRDWNRLFPEISGILGVGAESLEKERTGLSLTELEQLALERSNLWIKSHLTLFAKKSRHLFDISLLYSFGMILILCLPFLTRGGQAMWRDVYLSSWLGQMVNRSIPDHSMVSARLSSVLDEKESDQHASPPLLSQNESKRLSQRISLLAEQKKLLAYTQQNRADLIGLSWNELAPSEQAMLSQLAEAERNWGMQYYTLFAKETGPNTTGPNTSPLDIQERAFEAALLISTNRLAQAVTCMLTIVQILEDTNSAEGHEPISPHSPVRKESKGNVHTTLSFPNQVGSGNLSESSESSSELLTVPHRSEDGMAPKTEAISDLPGSPRELSGYVPKDRPGHPVAPPGSTADIGIRPNRPDTKSDYSGIKPLPGYEKAVQDYLQLLP